MINNVDPDPIEDAPFLDGVTMTDWTGLPWKDLPQERVAYILNRTKASRRGKIVAFLSKVSIGQGRKIENLPDYKTANSIRNSLYRAARKLWGAKSIKIEVTRIESEEGIETYNLEFVRLAQEEELNGH